MARKKITKVNFEFYGVVSEIDKEILKKIAEINSVKISYSATYNLFGRLALEYADAKDRLKELEEKRLDLVKDVIELFNKKMRHGINDADIAEMLRELESLRWQNKAENKKSLSNNNA